MRASKRKRVKSRPLRRLEVFVSAMRDGEGRRLAYMRAGSVQFRCALGRGGRTRRKCEGDGATPIGRLRILEWRFRPAASALARGGLKWRPIRRDEGWCDDPASGAYNRQVRLPFRASHEDMWRDDGKYDVVGVLDFNIRPKRKSGGSAIFFHVCDDAYGPTAGCIALPAAQFRKLLPRLSRNVAIHVG